MTEPQSKSACTERETDLEGHNKISIKKNKHSILVWHNLFFIPQERDED